MNRKFYIYLMIYFTIMALPLFLMLSGCVSSGKSSETSKSASATAVPAATAVPVPAATAVPVPAATATVSPAPAATETPSETAVPVLKTSKKKNRGSLPDINRADDFSMEAASVVARTYAQSNSPGGRVLKAAVELVDAQIVILGGCAGWVNKAYENAGFPAKKRKEIFKSAEKGPYGSYSELLPGDWIMYKNLPYNEIGHSAMFVEWIDFDRRSAITIEYVGGNRNIPGRYREADITKLFGIIRGAE